MSEQLKSLKQEVDSLQDDINFYHNMKWYDEAGKAIELWAKAIKNYNKAVTDYLNSLA